MRTQADDLTIAYIASGVRMAMQDRADKPEMTQFNADDWSGETGFMDAIVSDALWLDKVADTFEDHPGVWYYDVAEPYGFVTACALIDSKDTPDKAKILTNIMQAAGYGEMLLYETLKAI